MSTEQTGSATTEAQIEEIKPKTPAPTEGDKTPVQAEDDKTPEAATEGEKEDGTTPTEDSDQQPKKKADGGFQRRINRLTADFRREQSEKESLAARVRELEGKITQPEKEDDLKPPRLEDFKSYEDYEAARERHIADRTRRETLKVIEDQRSKEQATKAEAEQQARVVKARERFEADAEKVAEHYEDFDEVMDDFFRGNSPLKQFDRQAHEFIFEDANRPSELVFHLHKNEEVARRIAGMRPVQQVAELARLEASLAKPGAKNVTKAPAPPRSVGAKGGSDGKDPEKMTIEEMRKATGTHRIVRD